MSASVLFLPLPAAPPDFTLGGWLAVMFIGLGYSLGYYTWLLALKLTSPSRVAMFLALGPITAMALGASLLGELISPLFLAGLAAVIARLWLAHLPVLR